MIDESLIAFIQGLATTAGSRVHPALLPQEATYPAIAVTAVQMAKERALSGEVIRSTATYRLDVYGSGHSEVFPVSRALRDALDGYRGIMGTTRILHSAVNGPADFSDDDGDRKLRHHILDIELIYSEG